VLFLRHVGSGIHHPPAMNWTGAACGGVNDSEWAAMVKAGPCACSQSPLSPFSVLPSNPDIRRLYLYCVRGQISLQINSKTLWATL
jgi:hypothetical protein